eukprot:m.198335 g.198335  ORF g.198335 m.198335 type:complete len:971 (-) comp20411_c0_seq1:103-3015(-)
MRRREPAAPARQPGAVDMPSSSASSAKHGGGGRDAASRHVEDMAMEDLKDAINQVVLLQNVRGTLMDEIAQLKQRVATQAEAISVAEEVRETSDNELQALRTQLAETVAARDDAVQKADFAEKALAIAASEKEALGAQLEAIQCDVEALHKDNGDTAASLASRDALMAEQLERISVLEDSLSKQEDQLRSAKETEKRLIMEVEQAASKAMSTQSQNDAVRKAEVDMLEKQLAKLQDDAIRLNTELGLAAARRADAEAEAAKAVRGMADLETTVSTLKEQLSAQKAAAEESARSSSALRTELNATKLALTTAESQLHGGDRSSTTSNGGDSNDTDGMPQKKGHGSSVSAPVTPRESPTRPGGARPSGSLHAELERERSRAKILEAKLLKREAEAYSLGGDRAALDERLETYQAEIDAANDELRKLRASFKVTTSQNESLTAELSSLQTKASTLSDAKAALERELATARTRMTTAEEALGPAREAQHEVERLKKALAASQADIERLTAESSRATSLESDAVAMQKECATLKLRLEESESEASKALQQVKALREELATNEAALVDARRDVAAAESRRESDLALLEQQKKHVEVLLEDSRERVTKLESSLKESRAESEGELQRVKDKLDRLNSDYFEKKAEAASLEKERKKIAHQVPELEQKLADANLALGKMEFETKRLRDACQAEEARATKSAKALHAEQKAHKKLKEECAAAQAQVAGLQEIVQNQQTHGRALVTQLETVAGIEARAVELEEANAELTAELHSARQELESKAADYTSMVEHMRAQAKEESARHEESHGRLVAMLESLKKELYTHTKKGLDLTHELGQKDNRLDDALAEVKQLRDRCEALGKETHVLTTALEKAEQELAQVQDAKDETASAAQIASALGSDTTLMRQLSEARMEVARLKKEVKDARAASPKAPRAHVGVDIKFKVQLSQAQAQAKALKAENEQLKAKLEAAEKALGTLPDVS